MNDTEYALDRAEHFLDREDPRAAILWVTEAVRLLSRDVAAMKSSDLSRRIGT